MARFRGVLAGLAGLTLLAAGDEAAARAAPATAAQPAPVSPLVLTAPQKASPLVDPTTQFVRERLPESPFSEQYARFHDKICVKVAGLPPEFDAFVAKRIADMAAEVHAPLATAADCTPNIHVIFTPEPQAQLSDIAKRRDILIGYQFIPQLKRMSKFNRPIQAWYVTRSMGAHGESQLDTWDPDRYDPAMGKVPPAGRAGSRLANGMRAEIVHTLVLADANKVAGEKIETVADYVAVLALARWQGLERCAAIPTILNRLAENCDGPDGATNADLALLAGLYSVSPYEFGSQQRATIASHIRAARDPAGVARR